MGAALTGRPVILAASRRGTFPGSSRLRPAIDTRILRVTLNRGDAPMTSSISSRWLVRGLFSLTIVMVSIGPVVNAQNAPSRVVATINAQTGETQVNRSLLRQRLGNGLKITSIEIEKAGSQFFLVRTATRRGQCQTTATPLENVGGSLMVARRAGGGLGATASCSGDPCSNCRFTYTDDVVTGCKCADTTAGSKCNHTITSTTLRGIFRR